MYSIEDLQVHEMNIDGALENTSLWYFLNFLNYQNLNIENFENYQIFQNTRINENLEN